MTAEFTTYLRDLFTYLGTSPTAFHAVENSRQRLLAAGFQELREDQYWQLARGTSYFLTRDGALIAFTLGSEERPDDGFRIIASHSDSPALQLKPRSDYLTENYLQFGVEVYGGPLLATWFDRDLSLAGRICGRDSGGQLQHHLIDFQRPVGVVPSLAIHFDREANNGRAIDKQKFLPVLAGQRLGRDEHAFHKLLLSQAISQSPESDLVDILGYDLFLYDSQPPAFFGLDNEFMVGGRLDNLLSCSIGTTAMTRLDNRLNTMFFCANHEENGSTSTSGANGPLLTQVFERILPEAQARQICLHRSLLISMDNAHAVHPNFIDKSDPHHKVLLNGGPVVKINANQRYATNSLTTALFKSLAAKRSIPVQEFVMRSDLPCGSTIGPLTAARLGVTTIDVGVATLGMHSVRETAGCRDPYLLQEVVDQFLITEREQLALPRS